MTHHRVLTSLVSEGKWELAPGHTEICSNPRKENLCNETLLYLELLHDNHDTENTQVPQQTQFWNPGAIANSTNI